MIYYKLSLVTVSNVFSLTKLEYFFTVLFSLIYRSFWVWYSPICLVGHSFPILLGLTQEMPSPPKSWSISATFSSSNFTDSVIKFRSLMHLVLLATFLKIIFYPFYTLSTFMKNRLSINTWTDYKFLDSTPLIMY